MAAGAPSVRRSMTLARASSCMAFGVVVAACGAPSSPSAPVVPRAPAPLASAPVAAPPAPAPVASPPASTRWPTFEVTLQREIEAPSSGLALEVSPHLAAIAEREVWIHDARGWRSAPLPASALAGGRPALSVFYGRDLRVRVVGTRPAEHGVASVYLREKPQGLVDGGAEIGRFADNRGGLVAVLGDADPEIVCRLGDACVVKRRSGWTFIPIPADLERVTLGGAVGWALAHHGVERLGVRFEPVGARGPWTHADGFFALSDRVFVVESEAARVHVLEGASWRSIASPIARPKAIWGTASDKLWIVGDGIAYFDGARFRVAEDAPGPFEAVAGRDASDVWIAGKGGVFRVAQVDLR